LRPQPQKMKLVLLFALISCMVAATIATEKDVAVAEPDIDAIAHEVRVLVRALVEQRYTPGNGVFRAWLKSKGKSLMRRFKGLMSSLGRGAKTVVTYLWAHRNQIKDGLKKLLEKGGPEAVKLAAIINPGSEADVQTAIDHAKSVSDLLNSLNKRGLTERELELTELELTERELHDVVMDAMVKHVRRSVVDDLATHFPEMSKRHIVDNVDEIFATAMEP